MRSRKPSDAPRAMPVDWPQGQHDRRGAGEQSRHECSITVARNEDVAIIVYITFSPVTKTAPASITSRDGRLRRFERKAPHEIFDDGRVPASSCLIASMRCGESPDLWGMGYSRDDQRVHDCYSYDDHALSARLPGVLGQQQPVGLTLINAREARSWLRLGARPTRHADRA